MRDEERGLRTMVARTSLNQSGAALNTALKLADPSLHISVSRANLDLCKNSAASSLRRNPAERWPLN